MKNILIFLLIFHFFTPSVLASKPENEKPSEACEALLEKDFKFIPAHVSVSTLIPLSQLLGTRYCMQIAKNHIQGSINDKDWPTAGLAHMYQASRSAAEGLIDQMNIQAVRPNYNKKDLIQGASETLRLIFEEQPEYIRDAILIRDGVIMVVPLLKRVKKRDPKTKKPLYIPVIVKGHQKIEAVDRLAAGFAAWALGEYLESIPDHALIYLKPLVPSRKKQKKFPTADTLYSVVLKNVLPEVSLIHQRYLETISNPEKLSQVEPRRCTQCNVCPWASHCKKIMAERHDLSMIPYPPSREEAARLTELGYGDLEALARLDINSEAFVKTAIHVGVNPRKKMRLWVASAMAHMSEKTLVVENFDDPFSDVSTVVHVDFEDLSIRGVRSGVYLFGVGIQKKGRKTASEKKFIWAPNIGQSGIDQGWADFIAYFKSHRSLKSGKFKITVYSAHELVKFKQQFDIVTDKPGAFSASQRRSPYYSEGKNSSGERIGRVIRERKFFRKHKNIRPRDVFFLMDRMVDLLPYYRWRIALPPHGNSLKQILSFATEATGIKLKYPPQWNGLESIEWAHSAYETEREDLFEMIRKYNEMDIDANLVAAEHIRRLSRSGVPRALQWNQRFLKKEADVTVAAKLSRGVITLEEKAALIENILGYPVRELSLADVDELAQVLDRTEYLKDRRKITYNERLSEDERTEALQRLDYETRRERKAQIIDFFEGVRGELDQDALDQIARLFLEYKSDYLTPKSIRLIRILEDLKAGVPIKSTKKSAFTLLEPDEQWKDKLVDWISKNGKEIDALGLTYSDLNDVWRGLWFHSVFEH